MMKRILLLIFVCTLSFLQAQTKKVAILDFEITSNKTEYNGFGKALSDMLISDLKNNIDANSFKFYERGQLNKLLEEQNLQKGKAFDQNTAVNFGKLSGVNFVFIGSLFVLDGTCNISSRLLDVETSEILLTKDITGEISDLLKLKSELAENIALEINNPINIDEKVKEPITESLLKTYAKGLEYSDKGNYDLAELEFQKANLIDENFIYAEYNLEKIIEKRKRIEKSKEIEKIVDFEKIFYSVSDVARQQPYGLKQAEASQKAMNLIFDYSKSLEKLKDYIDDFIEISSDYPPEVLIDYDSETRYDLGLGEDLLNFNECAAIFRERASTLVKAFYYQSDVPLDEKRNQLWRTKSFYEWIIDNVMLPKLIRFEYGVLKKNSVECAGEYVFYHDGKVKSDEIINYTLSIIMKVDDMMDDDDDMKHKTLERLEKLKDLKRYYNIN